MPARGSLIPPRMPGTIESTVRSPATERRRYVAVLRPAGGFGQTKETARIIITVIESLETELLADDVGSWCDKSIPRLQPLLRSSWSLEGVRSSLSGRSEDPYRSRGIEVPESPAGVGVDRTLVPPRLGTAAETL